MNRHNAQRLPWLVALFATLSLLACGRSLPILPVESTTRVLDGGVLDGEVAPIVCGRGQIACDRACIDPRTDRTHCGAAGDCQDAAAGEACTDAELCVDGMCADSCPDSHALCTGACTDGRVDPEHCGASGDCLVPRAGVVCPIDEVCVDGGCTFVCPPLSIACDRRCVDPLADRLHCGANADCLGDNAGKACADGAFCIDGLCTALCPAGAVQCDGRCIDPLTDPEFCGASDNCTGGLRGQQCGDTMVCFAGQCTDGCPPAKLECDGRCIDPLTDPEFCGAAAACTGDDTGETCAPPSRCTGGLCQLQCPDTQLRCGDLCVDPLTDPMFCGASGSCTGADVGAMCALGLVCEVGQCTACAEGQIACNEDCIDPRNDRNHCGASADCAGGNAGDVCDAEQACVNGVCSNECDDQLLLCDGTCIDPQVDRSHCGASADCRDDNAGDACAQGELCDQARCRLDCPVGLLDCDGLCIQPAADPLHCGATGDCTGDEAGDVCEDGELCSAAECVDECPTGLSQCVGGCVDLAADRNNCGSCRQRCAPQETCVGGSCECPTGLTACDDTCVDVGKSTQHCGTCGNACFFRQVCEDLQCVCTGATVDCGGYCASLATDETDCGACGRSCRLFEFCSGGTCRCQGGFTDCDRGCTDTNSDARHCGGCNLACAPGQRCRGATCVCEPGFEPCGGTCVNTRQDTDHCGGCGAVCVAGQQCVDGQCECGPGHGVCDGACRDLSTSSAHCGACGSSCEGGQVCADGDCRCVLYVDADGGSDLDNGSSWGNALRTLDRALVLNGNRGCAIWLTGGTYYPTAGNDRFATFQLLGSVAIYGGFAGGESDPVQRLDGLNETVLSGDIGVRGEIFDNSYHVVHCEPTRGCRDTSMLDRITIEQGNANGIELEQRGGGMYCRDAMPTLNRVTFRNNEAILGGAIFSIWGEMRATDCIFEDNRAINGGALYILRADARMTRVRFLHNRSQVRGGAITQSVRAGLDLLDCVFSGNQSLRGGGIYGTLFDGEPVDVDATVFVGNVASVDGGGVYCGDDWNITDSLLFENRAQNGGGIHGWPDVSGTNFELNSAILEGGAMLIGGDAPATISNCNFSWNTANDGAGILVISGEVSIEDSWLYQNEASRNGGAVATRSNSADRPLVQLSSTNLEENVAQRGGAVFAGTGSGVSLRGCVLRANRGETMGGGIHADGATVELSACELLDNQSELGGGIHSTGASLALLNTTLWGNSSVQNGGGIHATNSDIDLRACSVVDNIAVTARGGGIRADLSTMVEITGSILWGNTAGSGSVSDAQYAGEGSGHITYSDVQGGCPLQSCTDDTTGNLSVDPRFVDASVADLQLQPGSQCIDAGNNAVLQGVTTDQVGNPRILGGTADMGALEYLP